MLAFSIDYYGVLFRATQSVGLFCTYKLPVPAKKRAAVFTPPPWENTVLAELDLFCLFRLKIVLQIIDIVACGIAQNAAL